MTIQKARLIKKSPKIILQKVAHNQGLFKCTGEVLDDYSGGTPKMDGN